MTKLIDFGPDPLPDIRRDHAQIELERPLPQLGEKPRAGVHGAGVVTHTGAWQWERFVNGRKNGEDQMLDLPVGLLLRGAHSRSNEPMIDIPHAYAQIDLAELADCYWYWY